MLVDFDWCGKAGEDCCPGPGTSNGLGIGKETVMMQKKDDEQMLAELSL